MASTLSHEEHSTRWVFSPRIDLLILLAIILVAIGLRLPGVTHGTGFHPDERHMAMVTNDLGMTVDVAHPNGMNPKSFAYGSFSFYAVWVLARVLQPVWPIIQVPLETVIGPVPSDPIGYEGLFIVGRLFCLFFGVAAIPLMYHLAIVLYRRSSVGLVASALLAFNVFHIQLSKFFTSDIPLTTLSLLAVVTLVHAYRTEKIGWYIAFGLCAGLATATKISSVFLAMPLALVIVLHTLQAKETLPAAKRLLVAASISLILAGVFFYVWRTLLPEPGILVLNRPIVRDALLIPLVLPFCLLLAIFLKPLSKPLSYAAWGGAVATLVFMAVEPFAILDYVTFTRNTAEQTSMVRGLWRPPYTVQYERTTPYFYHLKQMLWYTMGWPVFIAVVVGFTAALGRSAVDIVRAVFSRARSTSLVHSEILPVTFVIVFFATTAGFQVKFPRYLLPLYPFLCLFAGAALLGALRRRPNREPTP